jgi:hypothetical protein
VSTRFLGFCQAGSSLSHDQGSLWS